LETTTYSYDIANQLQTAGIDGFQYDANGNRFRKAANTVTMSATYDSSNRPTRIATSTGTETNQYGPNGERSNMSGDSIEGGAVSPQYDRTGNPVTDIDGSLGIWTRRLYGPGMDEPLAEWRRLQNRVTYLHRDALGSITFVSNIAGQVAYRSTYKAFGQTYRSSYDVPTTRLSYTGRETSVGGLMQYRRRYYDTSQGRFLQQDSYRGSNVTPPSLHRYTYVHKRPIDSVDPSGHYKMSASEIFFTGADIALQLTTFLHY
jgi:RHS repeat-associated protein